MTDFTDVMVRKAKEAFAKVDALYRQDLRRETLSDDLLYGIRSVVQDCQSALDGTACAVRDKFLPKNTWKPYFPIATDPADFTKRIEEQLKGLSAAQPAVTGAMERHQPYQPGHVELGYLHKLARANKHSDFSAQNRTESHRVQINMPGGGRIAYTPYTPETGGVKFGEGVTVTAYGGVPIDPKTGLPAYTTEHVQVSKLIGWKFVDPPVQVLPTLLNLVRLVEETVADVRHEADL